MTIKSTKTTLKAIKRATKSIYKLLSFVHEINLELNPSFFGRPI